MHVLVAHNRYQIRGGEDVVVDRETKLLEEAGMRVSRYFRDSQEIQGPSRTLQTALSLARSRKEEKAFREKIRELRPDIVHVHNYFPLLTPAVFFACYEEGVPIVHTLHNFRLFCANGLLLREGKNCTLCLDKGSSLPGVVHQCYRNSALATMPVARMIASRNQWVPLVDAFVTMTEFARSLFVLSGLPAEKLHVKSNFSPDLSARFPRQDQGYALYVGRLSNEKGIRTLRQAWKGMPIPLKFIGDGPLAEDLHDFEVHLRGSAEDVGRLLAGASLLVMPTECFEGAVPLVLLEAMSLGIPVVTSKFGAAGEVFREGENAWLFPAGDREGLRAAVGRALADSEKRKAVADAGRATYLREFGPERNLARLQEIYSGVLQAKRP